MDRPKLSVVIPAYNEETRLGPTLEKLAEFFKQVPYEVEIIVVDDGSSDGTFELARSFEPKFANMRTIKNEHNMGKGGAVKRGMISANGEFRLFYDADGSTPIEEIENAWRYLDSGYDAVIGSRALDPSKLEVPQPFLRRFAGMVFRWMVWILVVPGFRDTQCGFKVFSARATEAIFRRQRLTGFGFDVELLFLARKLGFKVKEMPVVWRDSAFSTVKLPRDAIRMFREILSIRWNQLLGRYRF
ncbi:MAG TPA: glycosyltransferase family 2 protein [Proteobacteria bacterium]|nr:glycosyltransferase family 2 protein [Pseudomonadota bacterium]